MKIMYGKAVLGMAKKRHICRKESGSFVRKYRLSHSRQLKPLIHRYLLINQYFNKRGSGKKIDFWSKTTPLKKIVCQMS